MPAANLLVKELSQNSYFRAKVAGKHFRVLELWTPVDVLHVDLQRRERVQLLGTDLTPATEVGRAQERREEL